MWGNEFTGTIPDLRGLSSLFELSLARNNLTGPVPAWLNGLTKLQGLWLNNNELTGPIPDLRALQGLYQLELSANQLGEEIPASLGTLSELQILALGENNLTGQIPNLAGLQKLFYLELTRNQLNETIPASLAEITGLQYVYLEENQLTGEIPAELGELTKLKGTRFANNALTGCVPHGLRVLLAAEALDLGGGEMTPAQDFIAVDANRDGDTDDEADVPGVNLPFCMLSALTLSDATLDPVFAPSTATYTAESTVASTTVTATLNDPGDRAVRQEGQDVLQRRGRDTARSGVKPDHDRGDAVRRAAAQADLHRGSVPRGVGAVGPRGADGAVQQHRRIRLDEQRRLG